MTGLVPHQFHEPLRHLTLDFEHHLPLQHAEPIVDEKERNEDRWDPDRHEPFIANMGWWMKHQSLCRELIVKLSDEWLERRALEPQPKLGNTTLEKLLVAQCCPISRFHLAHGITGKSAVTPPPSVSSLVVQFICTSSVAILTEQW